MPSPVGAPSSTVRRLQQDGEAQTGPTPTDQRKPSSKRHILTDANGSPLAVRLTGAKVHDSVVPEPAAASRTQRPATRGYSNHEPQVWVGE